MKKGSNGKIKCRFKRRRGGGLRGWLWGSLECRLMSPSYLILQFLTTLPLLLFVSSGRREGHLFDRTSRQQATQDLASWPAPPVAALVCAQ